MAHLVHNEWQVMMHIDYLFGVILNGRISQGGTMDSLQRCSQPSEKDAFTSTLKQNFSLYSKCFDSDI